VTKKDKKRESKLEVDVVHTSEVQKTLQVRADADRVDRAFGDTLRELRKKVRMDGFRPGKAPESVVRKRFADELHSDALSKLLPEVFKEALMSEGLRTAGEPKVSDVTFEEGKPLSFKAEVDVHPAIGEIDTDDIRVERRSRKLTPEMVDKGVQSVALRHSVWDPAERPAQNGDLVEFDVADVTPGENPGPTEQQSVVLGTGSLLPEFEGRLVGVSAGDKIEVPVSYPEDHQDERVAGRRVVYSAKVSAVRQRRVPPVDDELARSEGLENLDGLREKMREGLQRQLDSEADSRMRSELRDAVLRKNPIPIPEPVLSEFLEHAMTDWRERAGERGEEAEEKARESFRPFAEKQIAFAYLSGAIVEREGISVTKQDVESRVRVFAENNNVSFEEARKWLEQQRKVRALRDSIEEDKVFAWLTERAEIVEVEDE
jgi:trigger factor